MKITDVRAFRHWAGNAGRGMKVAAILVAVSIGVLLLALCRGEGEWALAGNDSRLDNQFGLGRHRLPHTETLYLRSGTYEIQVERATHHPFQVILHPDNGQPVTDETMVGKIELGKSVLLARGTFVVPQNGRYLLTVTGSDFKDHDIYWDVRTMGFSPRGATSR